MYKTLRVLLFLPSITFGIISAEIFPWAILYTLTKIKSVNKRLLYFIIALIISSLYTILNYKLLYINEVFRSVAAYINPLLLTSCLFAINKKEIGKLKRTLEYLLVFLLIYGILQKLNLLTYLEGIVKFIIPRGGVSNYGGERGVMLLSTEPSRAAFEIIFMYATWRVLTIEISKQKILMLDVIFGIYIIYVIKSFTGLSLYFIYLIFIYRLKIILLGIISVPLLFSISSEVRSLTVLLSLLEVESFTKLSSLLINESGFRLVSILSSYAIGLKDILGNGVGSWPVSSIKAMTDAGFDPSRILYFVYYSNSSFSGVRPTSMMANIMLDMGLAGLLLIIYYLIPIVKRALVFNKSIVPLLGIFIFTTFFMGDVGSPIPWISIVVAIRYKEDKKDIE